MIDAFLAGRLDRIAEKLHRAAAGGFRPFGVEAHDFAIDPPMAESLLAEFEARQGVELPPEYRGFLIRVSGGGAGPAYGLFGLQQALDLAREGSTGVDFLRTPFPRTGVYQPYEDPEYLELREREARGEISDDELEAEHERRGFFKTYGCLGLCDEGCGMVHLLVVTGPARGQMWLDCMVNDGGVGPLGMGFLDWYERWLDDVLAGGDGIHWMDRSGQD